jgi:hypothetical protein
MKLQFNETTYEFKPFYGRKDELMLFKDKKLVHTQFMHVDLFKMNLLTFDRCVDIIKEYENKKFNKSLEVSI